MRRRPFGESDRLWLATVRCRYQSPDGPINSLRPGGLQSVRHHDARTEAWFRRLRSRRPTASSPAGQSKACRRSNEVMAVATQPSPRSSFWLNYGNMQMGGEVLDLLAGAPLCICVTESDRSSAESSAIHLGGWCSQGGSDKATRRKRLKSAPLSGLGESVLSAFGMRCFLVEALCSRCFVHARICDSWRGRARGGFPKSPSLSPRGRHLATNLVTRACARDRKMPLHVTAG